MVSAYTNHKGFTLLEFLVAVVILMVGLLALLQTVNQSLAHNLVTQFRNEAVTVADEEMARELSKGSSKAGFSAISTTVRSYGVRRPILNTLNSFKDYSVVKTGTPATSNTKRVNIQVRWKYKGQSYSHNAESLISSNQQ